MLEIEQVQLHVLLAHLIVGEVYKIDSTPLAWANDFPRKTSEVYYNSFFRCTSRERNELPEDITVASSKEEFRASPQDQIRFVVNPVLTLEEEEEEREKERTKEK